MKLLELFKGTGSVGKVAKKLGFSVVSLDFDKEFKPDILTDILKWDYKAYHKEHNYIPDFIWASPPCNTFSPLAYPLKERNTQTAEPYSERAKFGTQVLYKTLEIIDYFQKLNPLMGFCIENPRGMMRKDAKMLKLKLHTTLYGLYGDVKIKPTDFWANYELDLKEPIRANIKHKTVGVCDLKLKDRYSIPPKLIKTILDNYIKLF